MPKIQKKTKSGNVLKFSFPETLMQLGADWCSFVQLGAVWCNLVHYGATWCSLVQCGAE